MTITRNRDHVEQAVANLVAQFEESSNLIELVRLYARQLQEVEDVLVDLLESIDIDTAISSSLDAIGTIVDEDRAGRNDDDYRLALRAKVLLLTSEGTREDVIRLIKSIIPGADVRVDEAYPAAFIATVLSPIDPSVTDVALVTRFIRQGALAGVGNFVVLFVDPPFQFDSGSGYDEGLYAGVF